MFPPLAFIAPTPLLPSTPLNATLSQSRPAPPSRRTRRSPRMIQSPDSDGPPDLEAFFDAKRRAVGAAGPPITLATGRALLANHAGSAAAAAAAALRVATDALPVPQLCHCTFSLDVDAAAAAAALSDGLPGVPLVGRSVNKKDAAGTVEVLLLRSDAAGGIGVASATASVDDAGGVDAVSAAVEKAAADAAAGALAKLERKDACTFMVFCHSPGGKADAARAGLDAALPGVIAYGGPAVGETESGQGWALIGGDEGSNLVRNDDVAARQTVHVAAVPGSLSFLLSAVVKTWAQPAYTESLSYMTPTYVDDPQLDLLTAIRYDDWEKFKWCLEDQGVDVNHKWVNKQNQIPLLAACARARTAMIKYLLDNGADVSHRNDGGYTAAMYTRMLTEYDAELIQNQLKMLEGAGANITLTPEEADKLKAATSGRIVE